MHKGQTENACSGENRSKVTIDWQSERECGLKWDKYVIRGINCECGIKRESIIYKSDLKTVQCLMDRS